MDKAGKAPINVNTATAEELQEGVEGIGEVLARRIMAYREQHGPFKSLSDLAAISGIAEGWLDKFGHQLSVGKPVRSAEVEIIPTIETSPKAAVGPVRTAKTHPLSVPPEATEGVVVLVDEEGVAEVTPAPVAEPSIETPEAEPVAAESAVVMPPDAEPEAEEMGIVADVVDDAAALAAIPNAELVYEEPDGESPKDVSAVARAPDVALEAEDPGVLTAAKEDAGRASSLDEELPELARFMEESEQQEEAMVHESGTTTADISNAPEEAPQATARGPVQDTHAAPSPSTEDAPERARFGFWRSALLVALGGLLGALLALGTLALLSGTLNFAPRGEYNALSRNVDTMQRNQELTWERVDTADAQMADLASEVARLGSLEGRLGTVEAAVEAAETTLDTVSGQVDALSQTVDSVSQTVQALDQRVGVAEDSLSTLKLSVDELQKGVVSLSERVARYDAFFAALRDLLDDLETPTSAPVSGE